MSVGIHDWRIDTGREPVVRIGVVLDEDRITELPLRVPAAEYTLTADGAPARPACGARITAEWRNDAMFLRIDDRPPVQASIATLTTPPSGLPLRGQGVRVHGIVAGRGFHWQKRVDQTLPGTLDLRAGRTGIVLVNELPLEAYLAGVITAEMSGECPVDFLRAQCIVARSWLLAFTERKHEADPFDRCNDDCCQRYQGTDDLSDAAITAVESTRGIALLAPDGRIVDANYSKSCGGVSERPEHVWNTKKPGLSSVVDAPTGSPASRFGPITDANIDEYLDGDWLNDASVYCSPSVVPEDRLGRYLGRVDETRHYFRWTIAKPRQAWEELLRRKAGIHALQTLLDLRVTQRGESGRATEIEVVYKDPQDHQLSNVIRDQYVIRDALHESFLFSSAFAVRIDRDADGLPAQIALRGAGWGHGVGFCQIGALGMALQGRNHDEIVRHYFPEAALKRVYE